MKGPDNCLFRAQRGRPFAVVSNAPWGCRGVRGGRGLVSLTVGGSGTPNDGTHEVGAGCRYFNPSLVTPAAPFPRRTRRLAPSPPGRLSRHEDAPRGRS